MSLFDSSSFGIEVPGKRCLMCGERKPLEEFYSIRTGRPKHRRMSYCKPCSIVRTSAYLQTPKGKVKARINKLKLTFGITLRRYNGILETQHGCCAICGSSESGRKDTSHLSVDHDHETGKVRGLLCSNCNSALGHFKDDPEVIRKAADYLENHRVSGTGSETLTE